MAVENVRISYLKHQGSPLLASGDITSNFAVLLTLEAPCVSKQYQFLQ